ncbi:MAG TPA: ribonuclease HII [Syntrophorhabdaceae bacterium]|nr:ribonuclease HII [Syntrophorhabdaceae bacterium]HPU29649.1 ribonuclease HII [Syntrophorhabdaceae bacterium]
MGCHLKGLIAGIDEAGRGPLAGPVVSSCVVWDKVPEQACGVNDSKLLDKNTREELFQWIKENAYAIGIGIADNKEIEKMNILKASLLSMERALKDAKVQPDLILIDGNNSIRGFYQAKPIIKGDRKCFFIACASIIAKVIRDKIMDGYHDTYPQYNFKENKGYPTREHRQAIERFGITPIHRKTYRGVKEYIDH